MSKSTWTGAVSTDWDDPGNWSPAGVPGAASDVTIAARDAVASASIGTVNSITDSSKLSFESAGTNTVTTVLNNTGRLRVDANGGEGGTTLNIGGTLTNSNRLVIGNTTLSASDEVTAASLDNTGRIYLAGSSANQALLDVNGAAGFGTAGVLSGRVGLAGDSAIEFKSGEITSLAANAQLHLYGNDAFIEDSGNGLGSNSALTGLASIGAGAIFGLHNKAAVSTSGSLANDGTIRLDIVGGDGGSSLTLAGALTNSGSLHIGNATLSVSDKVTAASLDNKGKIQLTGSGANQALLDVTAGSAGFGAAGVLSGSVGLTGDSAIEFASGQITSLAGSLDLNGNDAFIEDSTALGSNSALTGLASIGSGATFHIDNKAAVSTTGALANDGDVLLDFGDGDGGSSLTVGGTLTNSSSLYLGNTTLSASDEVTAASLDNTGSINLTGSGANQALLDVAGSAGFGAAGVLNGSVSLAGDSAVEFASGQITTIAAGSGLSLNGNDAFIEDSTATGSNGALTGLANIAGSLSLLAGAAVSTTGALANNGQVYLDTNYGDGGSSLTVAGALTNTGTLHVGEQYNLNGISAPDTVTAASLDNTGSIYLTGSSTNQALLDVTAGSAPGVLSGGVSLAGDSAVEFASGQITSLAASAQLRLNGSDAFIEDSTALGSNSALTGLASIGEGTTFDLESGAAVSTTGALVNDGAVELGANAYAGGSSLTVAGALTNSGFLGLDYYYGGGGSTLSIGGALTNTGTLDVGNYAGILPDTVTAASLDNTGSINLASYSTAQTLLDVTGTAGFGTAGVLSGTVSLGWGANAIEFTGGQITSLAGDLTLYGNDTFLEDSTALGSNSALTGLANIAGSLYLSAGAAVSTTGALANDGTVALDVAELYYAAGGSSLTIGGALTNTGTLEIGGRIRLGASDSVTANSFVNSGTVELTGNGTNLAALNVSGTTTNKGSISIASDTEELAGAVSGGGGSFSLSNADLVFDSSVSAGQTISETGADGLTFKLAQDFHGTISNFGTGDTIDATNFLETATSYNFVENIAGTGGTLTLTDTSPSLTANILMTGDYSNKSFTLAPDSGTGTLVKFV